MNDWNKWLVLAAGLAIFGCESKPGTQTNTTLEAPTSATAADASSAQTTAVEAAEPTHVLMLNGSFEPGLGDAAGLPEDAPQKSLADIEVPAEATSQLNEQSRVIVEQVLRRNEVEPAESADGLPKLVVTFGKEVGADPKRPMTHEGLLVKVDLQRTDGTNRAASRQIPPATSGGELMANLDHTLNALVTLVLEREE